MTLRLSWPRELRRAVPTAALACVPLVVLAASAQPTSAPVTIADLPAAIARPALGLSASEPVSSVPAVPGLGEALKAQAPAAPAVDARVVPSLLLSSGIPAEALRAYIHAADLMRTQAPGCHLSWPVLAGIGRVESNHGRFGGSVLGADGVPVPPIAGPRLDGAGDFAAVADTDQGVLDGDTEFDRAVGPMQFIPSTWARVGRDGDGNGVSNPQDIDDAAASAGVYLCAGGRDLRTGSGLGVAIFSYNHSNDYVSIVAAVARGYATGRTSDVPQVPQPSTPPRATATPSVAPEPKATR